MSLSFDLNSQLISSLKELDNAFARVYAQLQTCSDVERDSLHTYARVSIVGASTRIENAQLTDAEIHWLDTILVQEKVATAFTQNKEMIEQKLSHDRERSIEEVAGCREMLILIYENPHDFFPLKENDLRALHHTLLAYYPQAALYSGKYKAQSNSISEHGENEQRIVFETAPAGPLTQAAMHELIKWYKQSLIESPWPIAVACELVYRFLSIHPFQDGNGRLGRALFLMSLLHSTSETISYVSRYLTIDRFIEKRRQEYYFTLNRCSNGKFEQDSKNYKIHYFVKFMIKVLLEAIDNINVLRHRYAQENLLSPAASQVLKCFRDYPEIRLSPKAIQQKTTLPSRTIVFSLNKLLNKGLIQRYGQGAGTRYQLLF